jgi:hypothetical protein
MTAACSLSLNCHFDRLHFEEIATLVDAFNLLDARPGARGVDGCVSASARWKISALCPREGNPGQGA